MAKYLIAVLALASLCLADDAYAPPAAGGYAAPSGGYGAPDPGYGAPETGYGVDTGYAVEYSPQPSYGGGGGGYDDGGAAGKFDLSSLTEVLPLFLAVFAAIILTSILSPIIMAILGAFMIPDLSGILGGFGNAKICLINAILAPLGLQICNTDATPMSACDSKKRSLETAYGLNPDLVDSMATLMYNAIDKWEN